MRSICNPAIAGVFALPLKVGHEKPQSSLNVARSAGQTARARVFSVTPALGLPFLLAACGGGGGGGPSSTPTPTPSPTPTPPPVPTAAADSASATAGAALGGNVITNDTPAAGQNGAPAVSAVAIQGGAAGVVGQALTTEFGTLTLSSNGSFTYVPLDNVAVRALAAGQTRLETFNYTVTNSSGTSSSTLAVTLTGTNDAPVAAADLNLLSEDGSATIATGNVLSNDSDPDAGATLTVSQVNGQAANVGQMIAGTYGSLKINADGAYTYTLDNADTDTQRLAAGQTGQDSFTYLASDGAGGTKSATVTISVTGANDAPTGVNDTAAIAEHATPNTVVGNVLTNDSDRDTGTTLTVVQVNGGASSVGQTVTGTYGSLRLNADGSYTYTLDNADADTVALNNGDTGQDVFSYRLSDSNGGVANAQLAVTVNGYTQPADATDDVISIDPTVSGSSTFNIFANDIGAGLLLTLLGLNPGSGYGPGAGTVNISSAAGLLMVENDGTATYSVTNGYGTSPIGAGQSLFDVFYYSMKDAAGNTDQAKISITVSRAADTVLNGTSSADTLVAQIADTVLNGGGGDDVLIGSYGRDTLNGGAGNDRLTGWVDDRLAGAQSGGSDQFFGGAGDDRIIGGVGYERDWAVYTGKRSDYSIQTTGNQTIIRDLNPADGDEGQDILTDIEMLQFSDQTVGFPYASGISVNEPGIPDAVINLSSSQSFSVASYNGSPVFYGSPISVQLLNFDGTAAPSWLSFDSATQRIVGTAPMGFEGAVDLVIKPAGTSGVILSDTARLYFFTPQSGDTVGVPNVAEVFSGTGGADRIFGMGRDDRAVASLGADVYQGSLSEGTAWPVVDYSTSNAAVFLDLDLGIAKGGYAEGDILVNVGSVIGSALNDVIITGQRSEFVDPGAGDDHVIFGKPVAYGGSSFGSTYVYGGAGADIIENPSSYGLVVDYSRSTAAISVTTGVRGSGGDAEGDLLININSITGTSFDDVIRVGETSNPGGSSGSLRGGDGVDILQGHNGYDALFGGNGNDHLYGKDNVDQLNGGAGADRLDGGDGSDTVVYESGAAVQVDLVSGGHGGEAEGDTYFSIENVVVQSYANDIIWGDAGDNTLQSYYGVDQIFGRDGNDSLGIIISGSGNAVLDGGNGTDRFFASSYVNMVDLGSGTATFSTGGTATLISIENVDISNSGVTVYGSAGDNVLTNSSGGDAFIYGRDGNDQLFGSYGNDFLDGGADADIIDGSRYELQSAPGIDTASYASSVSGVQVDLRTGVGIGGDAQGDTLRMIDNLEGSNAADALIGNSGANSLWGMGGNDVLLSIGGNDYLSGGSGNDLLIGGAGQIGGNDSDILVSLDAGVTSVTGGAGADTFVIDTAVNQGAAGYVFSTAIQDFSHAEGDKLDLSDLRDSGGNALDLQDILDHTAVNGGNLVIDLSTFQSGAQAVSGAVTLIGMTDPNALVAGDFVFSGGIDWQAQLPSGLSLT